MFNGKPVGVQSGVVFNAKPEDVQRGGPYPAANSSSSSSSSSFLAEFWSHGIGEIFASVTGKQSHATSCSGWTSCLLVAGCLTSQQHASVSQGWICSDNFTCCQTETEVADQTSTDTRLTSPRPCNARHLAG